MWRNCANCYVKVDMGKEAKKSRARLGRRHEDEIFCSRSCVATRQWAKVTASDVNLNLRASMAKLSHAAGLSIAFRSTWERHCAEALTSAAIPWTYETHTLDTDAGFYTPDFNLGDYHIDVKGMQNEKQMRRICQAIAEGANICVVSGISGEPDWTAFAKMLTLGKRPIGSVYL